MKNLYQKSPHLTPAVMNLTVIALIPCTVTSIVLGQWFAMVRISKTGPIILTHSVAFEENRISNNSRQ
jgi:hypothetical protein